jgi:hypothetical protein
VFQNRLATASPQSFATPMLYPRFVWMLLLIDCIIIHLTDVRLVVHEQRGTFCGLCSRMRFMCACRKGFARATLSFGSFSLGEQRK